MSGSRTRPAQGARSKPADRRRREKAAQLGVQKPAPSAKPPSGRAARTAERRQAIIEAALDEFVARGFAATRLDDVAKLAGGAKGTGYLQLQDKEALVQGLIREAPGPLT